MEASLTNKTETLDGCEQFIHFLWAIRDARKGDQHLIHLFGELGQNVADSPMVIYSNILNMEPLSNDEAFVLKRILTLGGAS